MRYLICYDISDDKTRDNIVNYLERFALRVQYSVFSCRLDKERAALVWTDLKMLAAQTEGSSVLMVPLCKSCEKNSEVLGRLPIRSIKGVVVGYNGQLSTQTIFELMEPVALCGMDARIGFFHSNDGKKNSLIFDLIERFRQPVIDRFVLSLLNKKMIQPENFITIADECRLTDDGRIIFCNRYEEYMAKNYREYADKNSRDLIFERVKKFSEYLNR